MTDGVWCFNPLSGSTKTAKVVQSSSVYVCVCVTTLGSSPVILLQKVFTNKCSDDYGDVVLGKYWVCSVSYLVVAGPSFPRSDVIMLTRASGLAGYLTLFSCRMCVQKGINGKPAEQCHMPMNTVPHNTV